MPTISGTFPRLPAITARMDAADQLDDAALMQRVVNGERDAFATLYRRHQSAVYRFARAMTGSGTMAEDVVQDVFLAVMRDGSRWDSRRSALSTYLFGIARHHTRRRLLRERRFVVLDGAVPAIAAPKDGTADALVQRSELDRLRQALTRLPSRYREAIVLCELHELPLAEAAVILGCAVGTVKSRLHRGRQMLAERLQRAVERERPRVPIVRCEA